MANILNISNPKHIAIAIRTAMVKLITASEDDFIGWPPFLHQAPRQTFQRKP
jgi:hypothetical protein